VDLLDFHAAINTPKVGRQAWMDQCDMALGTTGNIDTIIDECIASGLYAIDLETSGLDNRVFNGRTVDHIAGICLSPDGVKGYYIPIAHDPELYEEHNVPGSVWRAAMKRLVDSGAVAIFHNAKFDQEFLQFNGGDAIGEWDSPKTYEDTMILAYLRNTRARRKSLKDLSKAPTDADYDYITGGPGLDMEMIDLHELWGHERPETGFRYDFTTLDPSWEPALWYAASDAICTFRLFKLLHPAVVNPTNSKLPNQRVIYIIEKLCLAATRWMERGRIFVNHDTVRELVALGQQEWFDSICAVYEEATRLLDRDVVPGYFRILRESFVADNPKDTVPMQLARAKKAAEREYPEEYRDATPMIEVRGKKYPVIYDANSPPQLGEMFAELGVKNLKRTEKSGQVKTSKDELDKIVEREGKKFPFMLLVKRFRETWKALSTYLYPMLHDCDPTDGSMHINFSGHKVDTGRFSTPAGGKKNRIKGRPKVNLQSIPATYDPRRPACMTRMRECIGARPGRFVVAIDYAGVELRLVTNLSREPKWLAEFFRCSSCGHTFDRGDGQSTPPAPPPRCPNCGSDKIGDLHTLTTLEIYGAGSQDKPEWKELRQNGKRLNFAMSYGGGGSAAQRAVGCDKNEGWRLKHQFDGTYNGLRNWWGGQHEYAKAHGYVLTAFGRMYPVPDIHSADGGFRSKAERNSVNGPIQGTSADVTKIAMGLVYKEFKKRGWLDKAQMIVTMHDELVFDIEPDILEEAVEVARDIMCNNDLVLRQRWPVPLTTDVEIGYNWTAPWDLNAMRAGEVRFIGNKKYKKAKDLPDGHDWDTLPSFPDDLAPYFQCKTLDDTPPTSTDSGGGTTPPPTPPSPTTPSTPPESPPPAADSSQGVSPSSSEKPAPKLPPKPSKATEEGHAVFEYHIEPPWTLSKMLVLADLIRKCRNQGLEELRLVGPDGSSLDSWREACGHPPVLVNGQQFHILAEDCGLS
jgi:DNA polymerase I-like protein with 3'-5' exonuclease and polymerase domains